MKTVRRFPIIAILLFLALLPLHALTAQEEPPALPRTSESEPLPPAEGSAPPGTAVEEAPLPAAEETHLPPVEGTVPAVPSPPKAGYIGTEQCRKCHEESYQAWIQTPHGLWASPFFRGKSGKPTAQAPSGPADKARPGNASGKIDCETCHGPGSLHPETPGDKTRILGFGKDSPSSGAERNAVCLRCHARGKILFWKESPHETVTACVDCHRLMDRVSLSHLLSRKSEEALCLSCHKALTAERRGSPHAVPGIFAETPCTLCHNPHGTSADRLLTSSSINENCYQCHEEKRGPFLFEHFPVTENCLLCHTPHGSVQKNLLKVRQPFLCLDCHANLPGTHDPLNPGNRYTYNRGCINCHPLIHGSNHPSGVRFQR